ncbi:MAG: DUF5686 and carboxypeptidase regulatory-like domain-containing protein [Draconibacterium sp.]
MEFKINAQVVTGRITNQQNEPVPYSTIYIPETKEGTTTNNDGHFILQLSKGNYHMVVRSMGYIQVEKEFQVNSDSLNIDIILQRQEFQIKEVKIFPGKEDPAYFIMRKAISKAPYYRSKIKHYEAGLYIRSNFAFTNIPKIYQNKVEVEGRKLKEVLKENVTYVIESQNRITFDYPNKYEQKVISKKTSLIGFEEPPVMELLNTSFYEERPNEVISPLSSLALRHYNFQYEGFINAGNFDVFKIKVTPKRKSDELVEGFIYIIDKLWCIYSLEFSSSFEFFDYRIKQQFENLGNNNWLPVSHNINGNLSALGLKGQFYYGASLKYDVVEDNTPGEVLQAETTEAQMPKPREKSAKEKKLENQVSAITSQEDLTNADIKKTARLNRKILKEQYKDSAIVSTHYNSYQIKEEKDTVRKDEMFWDTVRTIPLTPAEIKSYQLTDSLRTGGKTAKDTLNEEVKKETLFRKVLTGAYDLAKDSTVRLSYNGLISILNFDFNAVDGYKYKQVLNWKIYPDSGKLVTISPELGYAFNRKAVFGSVNTSFKNIFWQNSTLSIGTGKQSRDFKSSEIGIQPTLNAISTWFFAENYMKLYETTYLNLNINQRVKQGINVFANAEYDYFKPLKNNASYLLSDQTDFSPNIPKGLTDDNTALQQQKSFEYSIGVNYRKRQRKPWLEESPFLFIINYYSFNIQFKQGVKNVFSSVSDFSQLDFTFHQQADISPTSGIDWEINAGHFFNNRQMHFSQFKHFKTSEIPVQFQTFEQTLHLINDYELITNKSYLKAGFEYRSEYVLLRYLSFINRKTWSESLHFNYLTTSALHNYWEAGYSLNSLFFVGNVGFFAGFKDAKFESIMVKISIAVFD